MKDNKEEKYSDLNIKNEPLQFQGPLNLN